jgi:two-component system, OmpR family, alkaline phosphatase synthesis response regulator PhoP
VEERPAASYQGTRLTADFDAVSVAVDGDSIRLTRREFELLRYLVQNKNRVVSRDRLLERVWGYDRLVETRSVDVHVGRLRNKLRDAGRQIETVVGLGYRFID